MPARVLVVGLDAAEATLLERWSGSGRLLALAKLASEGATYRLENCWSTLPTSVWPELTTGRSPGKIALYFPPAQLRTGEAAPRPVLAEDLDPFGFWTVASDAGRRVAAVDLPWTVAPDRLNGVFLAEWGTHDRWFGTTSFPAGVQDDLRRRLGAYPVGLCDRDYDGSQWGRERLAGDLLRAVDHETAMLLELLRGEDWDLFACAYGQYQCVGHNFWGFMDADGMSETLRTAMADVYAKVDEGLGALREAAGRDSVSVVVASHGMGPLVGGPQLLGDVLVRLGAGSGRGAAAQVRSRLPLGVRSTVRRLVPGPARRRLQRAAGSLPAPLASPQTKAIALPADIGGYIRLNGRGREPNGALEPGAEAEAELESIRGALLELRHPTHGEPIVSGVVSAAEAFGDDRHPDLPDLMVSFRTDLGPLEACVSERVGLVKTPVRIAHRSGDHTGEARLWIAGPKVSPAQALADARAVDVAPTVLALLDVPVPHDLDGRPLVR